MLTIPAGLIIFVGTLLNEPYIPNFNYKQVLPVHFCYFSFHIHNLSFFVDQVNEKFLDAGKAMWTTLKFPLVWRPCLYMYLSFALSLNIHEGLFYWYTDSKAGPAFSQVFHFAVTFQSLHRAKNHVTNCLKIIYLFV